MAHSHPRQVYRPHVFNVFAQMPSSNVIIKTRTDVNRFETEHFESLSHSWNKQLPQPSNNASHNPPSRLSSDTFNPDAARNSKHRKHSRWSIIEQSSNQHQPSSRKDIRTSIPLSLPRWISWCADMAEGWKPDQVTFQPPPHESAAVVSLIARLSIPPSGGTFKPLLLSSLIKSPHLQQ